MIAETTGYTFYQDAVYICNKKNWFIITCSGCHYIVFVDFCRVLFNAIHYWLGNRKDKQLSQRFSSKIAWKVFSIISAWYIPVLLILMVMWVYALVTWTFVQKTLTFAIVSEMSVALLCRRCTEDGERWLQCKAGDGGPAQAAAEWSRERPDDSTANNRLQLQPNDGELCSLLDCQILHCLTLFALALSPELCMLGWDTNGTR